MVKNVLCIIHIMQESIKFVFCIMISLILTLTHKSQFHELCSKIHFVALVQYTRPVSSQNKLDKDNACSEITVFSCSYLNTSLKRRNV